MFGSSGESNSAASTRSGLNSLIVKCGLQQAGDIPSSSDVVSFLPSGNCSSIVPTCQVFAPHANGAVVCRSCRSLPHRGSTLCATMLGARRSGGTPVMLGPRRCNGVQMICDKKLLGAPTELLKQQVEGILVGTGQEGLSTWRLCCSWLSLFPCSCVRLPRLPPGLVQGSIVLEACLQVPACLVSS